MCETAEESHGCCSRAEPQQRPRLWTVDARQKMGQDMMKQTSNFGRRAQIYLYILSRDEDPAEMPEKEGQLREAMQRWKQGLGAEA